MSRIKKVLAVVVCTLAPAGMVFAQGGATGAITGTVQDASGSFISGANVNIVSEATGQSVRRLTTGTSGAFTATLLPVQSYSVEISAPGFATTKYSGVAVRITETTRMTAVMKVAAIKESIEVQSQVTPVDTTDATTGQSIASTTITALPLATRNFQQLLTLSSGASSDLNNASQLGRGQVFIHVNGGREDNNNYLIEGVTASDYAFGELTYTPLPSPDAIQEFKVSTSMYDATQGRNGGGNINATLKGGTVNFHGDVWEYFRNTSLDAHDYFLKKVDIKQNVFGGDLGGPIGPKAKLGFFYVNYQGTRQRSGASPGTFISTSFPYVPLQDRQSATLMANDCLVSQGVNAAVDPVAFSLMNVKSTQFGPGAGGYLFPLPTSVAPTTPCGTMVPFVVTNPGKFTDDQFTANWDRDFRGGKDHLSERFFWSDSDTFEPFGADSFQIQAGGLPGINNLNFPLDIPLHSRFGSVTETHIFSNILVNEFRFGVNVISDKLDNKPPVTGAQIGINLPTANGDPNMYRLQFGSWAFGPYTTQQQKALSDTFVWLDTVSWTRGAHQLRFGGEIDRTTIRRSLPIADNGLVFFVNDAAGFGTDFQSFLAGAPLFGEAGGGVGDHDYRIPAYSWFVQDDYRASKSLTLNLGFRNELLGAPYDKLCHIGNTDPTIANSSGQPFVYPGCVKKYNFPGLVGTKQETALNNNFAAVWEPRIGFAYDLGGKHTTVVRGGYGIYSVREDLGAADNLAISAPFFPFGVNFLPGPGQLANLFQPNPSTGFLGIPPLGVISPAFVPQPSFFTGFAPNCTLGNGNASTNPDQCSPSFSGNVAGLIGLQVPLHWVAGTTQQWNLTVQRELPRNWFVELGYVGTKGTRLRSTFDPNQGSLATPQHPVIIPGINCDGTSGPQCVIVDTTAENVAARAPFRPVAPSAFESFAPNSDSHYNSLQASLGHHFSKGLYWQSAYTYAKSIDDVSTASVAFVSRVNDQTNARASRGLSDFDRRHRFVTSWAYQLPFFSHATGAKEQALGGWELSGVVTLQSGTPFTIMDSAGGSAYALASPSSTATLAPGFSCANSPASGSTSSRLAHWVNPAAYVPDPVIPLADGSPGDATAYGNAPRNCIIGPPQKNVDLTLGKAFRITEGQSLRFRADFFNLFNHPSFANPTSLDVENPSAFTEITSTVGTPRLIQFSLKYSF